MLKSRSDSDKQLTRDNWEFRWLSKRRSLEAAKVQTKANVEALKKLSPRLVYEQKENVIQAALMGLPSVPPTQQLRHWEYFKDPGPNKLTKEHTIAKPEWIPRASHEVNFTGRYMSADVSKCVESALYTSTGYQMVGGEFFSFSKKTKTAVCYQVSDRPPQNHPFKRKQLLEMRKQLQLDKHGYKLVIAYVLDASGRHPISRASLWRPRRARRNFSQMAPCATLRAALYARP